MFRSLPHYYPILRLKQGELTAISNVNRQLDMFYTPIFEILPELFWKDPPRNKDGSPQKDQDGNHLPQIPKDAISVLRNQATRLMNHCNNERPLMIDMHNLTGEIKCSFPEHPLARFFKEVRNTSKLSMIPVSGLTSKTRPREYQEAIRICVEEDKCKVCLRLTRTDILMPDMASKINDLLHFWGVGTKDVFLLLDLQYVDSKIDLEMYMQKVPFWDNWHTVILASGAFPKNDSSLKLKPNNSYSFPRNDWSNWNNFVTNEQNSLRKPHFSDYAAQHPEYSQFRAFFNPPTAKITWTLEDKWVMERGESIRTRGQFPFLAQALFGQDGLEDSLIKDCQADQCLLQIYEGTLDDNDVKGDLTSWIGYSTERHITLTILQLCDLFEQ